MKNRPYSEVEWSSHCCDSGDGECLARWNCQKEEEGLGMLGCHRARQRAESVGRRQLDTVKGQTGANVKAIGASGAGKGDSGSGKSDGKTKGGADALVDSSGGTL